MSEAGFSKREFDEQGWSPTECPGCQGRGYVTKTYDDYGMADPKDVQCPTCKGMTRVVPARRAVADEGATEQSGSDHRER